MVGHFPGTTQASAGSLDTHEHLVRFWNTDAHAHTHTRTHGVMGNRETSTDDVLV